MKTKLAMIFIFMGLLCSLTNASSSSESSSSSSSESSSSSSSSGESSKKVKYSYTLWIGDNVDRHYTIDLKSKPGTTFINAMRHAATKDKHFKFEQTIHPVYGVLVHEICGVTNDKTT